VQIVLQWVPRGVSEAEGKKEGSCGVACVETPVCALWPRCEEQLDGALHPDS
jgi:hypothetical protein